TSEEKPKEGGKAENEHIDLKAAGQDGSVVQLRIKRHSPLSKLRKGYCCPQVGAGTARGLPRGTGSIPQCDRSVNHTDLEGF
uniref:Uncharacterized protein n=1 Tax=Corvus moneduloides TaxID=1196302 RepID=A0A8U7NGL8_CORMO